MVQFDKRRKGGFRGFEEARKNDAFVADAGEIRKRKKEEGGGRGGGTGRGAPLAASASSNSRSTSAVVGTAKLNGDGGGGGGAKMLSAEELRRARLARFG